MANRCGCPADAGGGNGSVRMLARACSKGPPSPLGQARKHAKTNKQRDEKEMPHAFILTQEGDRPNGHPGRDLLIGREGTCPWDQGLICSLGEDAGLTLPEPAAC